MDALPRREMLRVAGAALVGFAVPLPLHAEPDRHTSTDPGDEMLLHEVRFMEELDAQTYRNLWSGLRCLTEEELDWKPHAEANSLRWVVGHLNWFEDWVADAIEGKGLYLEARGGPTSFQERPIARQKERFDAARDRLVTLMRGLTPEDLRREIQFVYNENYDRRPTTTIRGLLKTHSSHLAGHQYQGRYIRGTYSRAHGTDKACFDPW